MCVIAKGILRGCQGLFTPVSLGYPLHVSVFNKNSTLKPFFCKLPSWQFASADAAGWTCGPTSGARGTDRSEGHSATEDTTGWA